MRINEQSLQGLIDRAADLNTRQTSIAKQISSGLRLTALSDDPAAAGQAVVLSNSLRYADSFLATAATATSRLQAADTALGAVVTQLTSAVATTIGAVSGTSNPDARAAAAQQLTSIRTSLLALANSGYNGAYLFSGTSTAPPFQQDSSGNVAYSGNAATGALSIGSGVDVKTATDGASIFLNAGSSVFGALNAVIANLTAAGTTASTDSTTLVANLRSALTNVSGQREMLNATAASITAATTYTASQKTNLQAEQSSLLSADITLLATELSAATTQRSALLSSIAIVEKGSLFDYL